MSATVAFAACSALPEGDGDDDAVLRALTDLGVRARWIVWDDPDPEPADLVVLRATWDYAQRRTEFLAWCAATPGLVNAAGVVRWNTDKTYLVDLAGTGLPVVPTQLVPAGTAPDWPDGEFVVKPAVGAGSRGAARFADRDAAAAHLAELHHSGAVIVQPYQRDVDASGETALVFLRGGYSHAFTKSAMLRPDREVDASGVFVTEELGAADPDAASRTLAEDALDAAAEVLGITRAELLYARVDVVRGEDGGPLLLELELAEPSLGLRQADVDAAWRFASAIRTLL